MQVSVKCMIPSCHQHAKPNVIWWQSERERAAKAGATATLCCPRCLPAIVEDDANYVVDMPLGEVIAELAKETPRWRTVWIPKRKVEEVET